MDVHFPKEKKMRVVAIVYLLLLSPILAMEKQSLIQLNYERNQEWEKKQRELREEVKVVLKSKNDIIASAHKDIREKCSRLSAPKNFPEELEAILKLLSHPEELLSIEQRRTLIGFPLLENFQPIDKTRQLLEKFIDKWQSLAACAETLQLAANQTLWYDYKWSIFIREIISKLLEKNLCNGDLLKIYNHVSFFHAGEVHLATAYKELIEKYLEANTFIPDCIKTMQGKLTNFFNTRGDILWEIIRYADLRESHGGGLVSISGYAALPQDFFLDTANPIKKLLSVEES